MNWRNARAEIRELHARTTLGAKEGLAFRYVSRPVASALLWLIQGLPITPNQVTWCSFLTGALGAACAAIWLHPAALWIAALAFVLAHILDALDGQLARHRGQGSELGHQLDFFIDELKAFAVLVALALRALRLGESPTAATGWTDPLWLLRPVMGIGLSVPVILLCGVLALAIGLSCTRFFRLPAWRDRFGKDGGRPARGTGIVARIERVGRFVVDYPSWLPLLLLALRFDLYLLLYPLVLVLYAVRALATIFWRTFTVRPLPPH